MRIPSFLAAAFCLSLGFTQPAQANEVAYYFSGVFCYTPDAVERMYHALDGVDSPATKDTTEFLYELKVGGTAECVEAEGELPPPNYIRNFERSDGVVMEIWAFSFMGEDYYTAFLQGVVPREKQVNI
jgi:hypothetical protein